MRCSSGTLRNPSATLRAAMVQQEGTKAGLKCPAAAAGHKLAHSKTRVELEDSVSSRQVFLSLTSYSKHAFRQAMGSLCVIASELHGNAGLAVAFDAKRSHLLLPRAAVPCPGRFWSASQPSAIAIANANICLAG